MKDLTVEQYEPLVPNKASFVITRVVVYLDQRVYELREQLDANGVYSQLTKRLLLNDARKLGVVHYPAPH